MKPSASTFILATICYADIFDWPLTPKELIQWCIMATPSNSAISSIPEVKKHVVRGETYMLLRGPKLVSERQRHQAWSRPKRALALRVGGLLRLIPTLRLVGITGGLSRNNTRVDDDIDLFFIVSSGSLWSSRLLAIVLVELLGIRRRPGDTKVTNKICLNMFMSEDALSLIKNEHDLFAAHEVLQMQPLWERGGTYKKFLMANRWVGKFLPNAWKFRIQNVEPNAQKRTSSFVAIMAWLVSLFELPARELQLWYMRKRRTTEVIAPGVLRFHPADARVWIKKALATRLRKFNIPLDKIFYGG